MIKRALTLSLLVCGCSAVPDLKLPLDDAGVADGGDSGAGARDGSSARDASDGAPDTCSRLDPADVCCGTRTCSGDCTASNCSKCENGCSASELCCVKGNKVTCTSRSNPSCN